MDLSSSKLNGVNITIVYDQLNRDEVSRDKIRKLMPEKPIINDLPDMILIIYQQKNIHALIEDRRIRVNVPVKEGFDSAVKSLVELGVGIVDAINGGNIVAYGLNYDGAGKIEEKNISIENYFKEKFFKPQDLLESRFGGEVVSVSPQFTLRKNNLDFNISLIPTENSAEFKYHLNAHFRSSKLPSIEKLTTITKENYELFEQLWK